MGLFRKKLSSVNNELLLVAKLCREKPDLRTQLIFVLEQPEEKRLELISKWLELLPEESELYKSLQLLNEGDIALAMLDELKGMSDAQ
ncbi:MAG: hypothetical protein MK132_14580 [Lentisphaerales bacterium]|nr:hypothetical protein [Lentisphaerales bacterium]